MEINETSFCINVYSLLALCFATIIFTKWLCPKHKSTLPLPPGPTGYPIVGCMPEMIKNKPTFRWIHQLMQERNTEIACIRLGSTHVIPVTSPELAREFLRKQDVIFASRPYCMSGKLTSIGYLTTVLSPMGDQWKKMRRIVASEVLSPATHRWLCEKICEEADHLIRYVYKQSQNSLTNGLVNVRIAALHYCGNVMRKLMFSKRFFGTGKEDGGPGLEEEEYVDGLFTILKYLYGFAIADYLSWLEVFDLDGYKRIIKNAIKRVRKYQDPEINKRIKMWQQGVRKTEEDLLDVLINLKDSKNNILLSIQEIKAQITEIKLAAIDNPSNAVEWVLAEMINQPYILDKAGKELDQIVGRNRLVDESDLQKLNYVKACAKEAFRLHPVAPFNVPRVSTEDTVVGGYFIPKGSHVLLSRPGLGRNPRVWEDPLVYKPERHIINKESEVVLVDHELRMLSFSSGRRGCPAIVLGSTMTIILLARLIQGFSWSAATDGPNNTIDLAESKGDLSMAKPLIAHAIPRASSNPMIPQAPYYSPVSPSHTSRSGLQGGNGEEEEEDLGEIRSRFEILDDFLIQVPALAECPHSTPEGFCDPRVLVHPDLPFRYGRSPKEVVLDAAAVNMFNKLLQDKALGKEKFLGLVLRPNALLQESFFYANELSLHR
ncbi:UNVERIFIED_CONTAM: Phenylalanine N-monooxygenase CYP79D16 [Sesamum latifolium]|uniref:Phenylalanine N-monooxygenase CYP79D16 n=1 Tax=Sesamum latifolium TaxID=2727402 RepID=A0AAW2VXY1_9LAMI